MRQIPRLALFGALVAGALVLAEPAGATSYVVSNGAEYAAAITAASGDNTGPHTITLDADVTVTADPNYTGSQALTIDGDGFTLSGGGTQRAVRSQFGVGLPLLTITDITVRDAFSTGSGGAVNWGGPVTVTDARFLDNTASGTGVVGGGAISSSTPTTISGSLFSGNSSSGTLNTHGSIVVNGASSVLTITDSTFRENTATSSTASGAGGAAFSIGTLTATRSVFADNGAVGANGANGGALYSSGTITLDRAVVHGNSASGGPGGAGGGGVFAFVGATVTDSSLTGNDAVGTGGIVEGAAASTYGTITATDTTVAGNHAKGATANAALQAEDLTSDHVTIARNTGSPANLSLVDHLDATATAIGQPAGGAGCEIGGTVVAASSVADDAGCGLPVASPIALGPPRGNGGPLVGHPDDLWGMATTFPLAGSVVLDQEPTGDCADTLDQRGRTRPFGPACDAGAIEGVYGPHGFTDVPVWVEDAVRWLASEDVSDPSLMVGLTPTTFGPSAPITRAQVVRMLYRVMDQPDPAGYPPHPFTDVPAWVEDAVRWAHGEGIVTGETPTTFAPNDPITRAQVVRMIYRVAGSPDVSGIDPHPFSDVPVWVQDAVTWAADPENPLPIVTGETPTLFRPQDDITRAQVGRMVYRLALTPAAWEDTGDAPSTVPFRVGGVA